MKTLETDLLDSARNAQRVASLCRQNSQIEEMKAGIEGNDRLKCLQDAVRYKRIELAWLQHYRRVMNQLQETLEA